LYLYQLGFRRRERRGIVKEAISKKYFAGTLVSIAVAIVLRLTLKNNDLWLLASISSVAISGLTIAAVIRERP